MRRALGPLLGLLAGLAASGCHHEVEIDFNSAGKPPTVQLIDPQVRNLVRVVGHFTKSGSHELSMYR